MTKMMRAQNDAVESMSGGETLGDLLSSEPEPAAGNRKTVKAFYGALARSDAAAVSRVVAADLEWWFHGPPHCQHLMRLLTGESRRVEFKFKPRSVTAIGDRVIVEGWQGSKAYWAHVWTLKEGIMRQLREYFDTWLTVIVRVSEEGGGDEGYEIIRLWQSEPKERLNRSLPDVVLPI
ncbi:NTF2-like domain containing protein [Trema orientale]|uniref:NTF2-like domain containing protein n=1 Tax=Trema orientale TaxID=63057 RepID=A0A2P5AB69_TREOI|nr:NTF2-like domain containing protein [Trema orientale]